jgi:UDP-2,3-diacylglucosamine hydrolase
MLRIPRDEPVLFASDMHLAPESPRTAQRFFGALRHHGPGAAHVMLLGDLFELWVGDDGADALADELAELLSELSASGTRIWLMRGNRDFLLNAPLPTPLVLPYAGRCGATLLHDPTPLELHGVPALLAHGDAFCTDDLVYQQWRTTCRDPAWQQAFLARPLAERFAVGRAVRDTSEAGKREKPGALMDVNTEAVTAAMRATDAQLLVHGHTHRPAVHTWVDDTGTALKRVVLTDWDNESSRGTMLLWRDAEPVSLAPA